VGWVESAMLHVTKKGCCIVEDYESCPLSIHPVHLPHSAAENDSFQTRLAFIKLSWVEPFSNTMPEMKAWVPADLQKCNFGCRRCLIRKVEKWGYEMSMVSNPYKQSTYIRTNAANLNCLTSIAHAKLPCGPISFLFLLKQASPS